MISMQCRHGQQFLTKTSVINFNKCKATVKLVAMLGLVPSAYEMENAFTCAQERPGNEAINHQSAALKAIFTHR